MEKDNREKARASSNISSLHRAPNNLESKFPRPSLPFLTTMCRASSRAQACSSLPSGEQVPAPRPAAPYHLEGKFPHPGRQVLTIWRASSRACLLLLTIWSTSSRAQACKLLSVVQVPAPRPAVSYHLECKFPRPCLQLLTIWRAGSRAQACSSLPPGVQVPRPGLQLLTI